MNGLDDPRMVRKLYTASQAGVSIDLIIRGHCSLRPGLPGFSENIRVMSILGRYLEHDRVFYFHNNGQPQLFIGSADWRTRNLTRRVELATPVVEPALQQQLIDILQAALGDNRLAWDLDADGHYRLRTPAPGEEVRDFQATMMAWAQERAVENALVKHVTEFLLELGAGFAFVGRQVHLEVGDHGLYVDLLFYHLKLRRYVVLELKAVPFDPSFVGQLNVYLSAVDDLLRHPDDKPTIGLLLCRSKHALMVEYALRDLNKPIGVAGWETALTGSLPTELKGSLPTIEELEAELGTTRDG